MKRGYLCLSKLNNTMKKVILIISIMLAVIAAKSQATDTLYVYNVTGVCVDTAYMTNDTIEFHFDLYGIYFLHNINHYSVERVSYDGEKLNKVIYTGNTDNENEKVSRRPTEYKKSVSLQR